MTDPSPSAPADTMAFVLRMTASRMQMRVDAIEERDGKDGAVAGKGIGIGYLLASEIVRALNKAADFIEGAVEQGPAGYLKRCPFCGGEARKLAIDGEGWVIECQKCRASTCIHADRAENLESDWNRRLFGKEWLET